MNPFKDYREIAERISKLSGLTMDEDIPIRNEPDIHKDRLDLLSIAELVKADHSDGVLRILPSPADYLRSSITPAFNILCEYNPTKKEIVLYDALCEKTAKALTLSKDIVAETAYAHSVTHAIIHLGKDSLQKTWEYYDVANIEDKELFAHIYPFMIYYESDDIPRKEAFSVITQRQEPNFNLWENHIHLSAEEINRTLIEARQKPLPEFTISFAEFELQPGRTTPADILTTILESKGRVHFYTGILDERETRTVNQTDLHELRKVIVETGVMGIEENQYHDYINKIEKLDIKYGKIEKKWSFYDGRQGAYQTIFNKILTTFKKACRDAQKKYR